MRSGALWDSRKILRGPEGSARSAAPRDWARCEKAAGAARLQLLGAARQRQRVP